MNDSINVAVVGAGYWGPNLIRNFNSIPNCRLLAVCDRDADQLAKITSSYPGVEMTSSYEALLARTELSAVVIATPVSTHYHLAKAALKSNKHVLVEKPMSSTAAEAQELIELAESKGLVLMVDHTFVYTGAVQKMRQLVEQGEIGEMLYYDSVRINLGLFQHDVNVLWDLAVHDLAIMDYVIGEKPTSVSATGHAHLKKQQEDIAYLTCFFRSNLIAHIHVNWLSPVKIRRTILSGNRKMVVYDDLEPTEKIKVYDRGAEIANTETELQAKVDYRMGDMLAPHIPATEALRAETLHFIECIANGARPRTDGHAGLRVLEILEAANQSLAQRGKPVELAPQ